MRSNLSSRLTGFLLVVTACSGEAGYDDSPVTAAEESAELGAALTNQAGDDPFSNFANVVSYDAISANTSYDPAVCWKQNGYVTLYVNASSKLMMLATDTTGVAPAGATGGDYRSSKWYQWKGMTNFNARPACVNLDPVDSTTSPAYKMLAAGRATNNKFVTTKSVQIANVGSAHLATPTPEEAAPWHLVSNETYVGGPAMSASSTKGIVVISGIRSSDSRLISYTRSLSSFDSSSWSGPFVAGALPTGYTAIGTPAIAMTGAGVGTFTVIVRGTNGSQSKFFFTYFSGTSYGVIQPNLWLEVAVSNPSSDPALEFSTSSSGIFPSTLTLAFRKGTSLYQTSGLDQGLGTYTEWNIGSTFVGGPAIKGVRHVLQGEYYQTIVGRRSDGKLSVAFVENGDMPLTE